MSGLGIGGTGSDDYNIRTEQDTAIRPAARKRVAEFGANGQRWDEECADCGRTTVICNDCDCCERHCACWQSSEEE